MNTRWVSHLLPLCASFILRVMEGYKHRLITLYISLKESSIAKESYARVTDEMKYHSINSEDILLSCWSLAEM